MASLSEAGPPDSAPDTTNERLDVVFACTGFDGNLNVRANLSSGDGRPRPFHAAPENGGGPPSPSGCPWTLDAESLRSPAAGPIAPDTPNERRNPDKQPLIRLTIACDDSALR